MNWGYFKELMTDLGVKDEDEIRYIDISGESAIIVKRDEKGEVAVYD